jgi:hypothetical protein
LLTAIAQVGKTALAYASQQKQEPINNEHQQVAQQIANVEQTVKNFLLNYAKTEVWEKEGGQYRLEYKPGFLQITDKQGDRGIIFQRERGDVFSKLGEQDFAHFAQLATRMEQAEQRAQQTQTSSTAVNTGIELE